MNKVRAVFMGTPDFAVTILKNIIDVLDIILVVSQPDKQVGRKKILTSSPVKEYALLKGIEVFTPSKLKNEYDKIIELNPDIIITCAYGQIVPKIILDLPKYGCINVHGSLLPKWRGGAPIQRSIMNGDDKTGITIMYMDEKLDSGDIISKREIDIEINDNYYSLSAKLEKIGAELLLDTLPSIINGTNDRIKQDESLVTYAPIISKEDEIIDFNKTKKEIYDLIRALNPCPGAYFMLEGKRIKVYKVKMGDSLGNKSTINNIYEDGIGIGVKDGEIILLEIKPEGKNKVTIKNYLNGKNKERLKGMKVNV